MLTASFIALFATAIASFLLVNFTPEHWVFDLDKSYGKRIWGVLLTPGLVLIASPLAYLVDRDGFSEFWSEVKEYLAAVWLGRKDETV